MADELVPMTDDEPAVRPTTPPATVTLASLTADALVLVVQLLPIAGRGRLASVSRMFAALVGSDDAWMDAWVAAVGTAHTTAHPRDALKSLRRLDAVHWQELRNADAPRWRQHFAAVSCGNYVLVCGGSSAKYSDAFKTWAYDLRSGAWCAAAPRGRQPDRRRFNADAGGARVLLCGHERWMCFFGGHRMGGPRDNETWILGPIDAHDEREPQPPSEWRWIAVQDDGRMQSPSRPTTRFHHTLTVVGGRLHVCGGHNFAQQPIWDMGVLSLSPPEWEESAGIAVNAAEPGEAGGGAIEVAAEWVLFDDEGIAGPETGPGPRARHGAAAWERRGSEFPALVIFGGGGGTFGGDDSHGDTWVCEPLANVGAGSWECLPAVHPAPPDRVAMSIVRDRAVVLDADCSRACEPGLWVLDLFVGRHWALVHLPHAALRSPSMGQTVLPLLGGEAIVIFGGARPQTNDDLDDFLDPSANFCALHETAVVRPGFPEDEERHPALRAPPHTAAPSRGCTERPRSDLSVAAATLATAGAERLQAPSATPAWHVMREEPPLMEQRFLMHGLQRAAELNGRVGLAATEQVATTPDERVSLHVDVDADGDRRFGGLRAPRRLSEMRGVKVRRANLVPSALPTPAVLLPIEGDDSAALALHASALHSGEGSAQNVHFQVAMEIEQEKLTPDWAATIRVSRLSLLPRE